MRFLARRLRSQVGFTLLEMVICGMVASGLSLAASKFITKPTAMAEQMLNENAQLPAIQALDTIANDISQTGNLDWTTIPPSPTGFIDQLDFYTQQYQLDASFVQVHIHYMYQPTAITIVTTSGNVSVPGNSIIRETLDTNGNITAAALVLTNVDPPTATPPTAGALAPVLFQSDTNPITLDKIVIITVLYHPVGYAQTVLMRRVAIGS